MKLLEGNVFTGVCHLPLGPYPHGTMPPGTVPLLTPTGGNHIYGTTGKHSCFMDQVICRMINVFFWKNDSTYIMLCCVQCTLKPSFFRMSEVIMPPFEQFNSFTQRLTLPPLSSHDQGFAMQASGSWPRSTYCSESRLVSMPPQICINQ